MMLHPPLRSCILSVRHIPPVLHSGTIPTRSITSSCPTTSITSSRPSSSITARRPTTFIPARCVATSTSTPSGPTAQMLYDGSCPICAKEVSFLRTFQKAPAVAFINITDPAFDPSPYSPITLEDLVDEMHVYDIPSKTMHKRVPAFHHLYSTLGYPFLGFTKAWPFNILSDKAYGFIARNKHHLARFMK